MIFKFKKSILLFLLLLLMITYVFLTPFRSSINHLKIHYIDVGQGDATLIEHSNKIILIDSGPNEAEKPLIKYLKTLRIKKIDYIFITHPHEDHIGNLDKILSDFKVDTIFMPKFYYESKDLLKSLSMIKEKNINLKFILQDFRLKISKDIYLDVFSSKKKSYENPNNYSPLIKVVFKEDSFLFTGDNELEGELEFITNNIDVDVLKVGHHGSNTSSSDLFLTKVTPKVSIISCGKNNKFNHPNPKALNRILNYSNKIYRTDEDGTIIINSFGDSSIKIEKK